MTATLEKPKKAKKPRPPRPAESDGTDVLGEAIAQRPPVGPTAGVLWSEIAKMPLDWFEPHPANRELTAEQIADVAASMTEKGQGEPIKARPIHGNRYQIISGETRWRAAKQLGWKEIDVRVAALTDAQALEYLAESNAHRHDLTPIDKARLIATLCQDPTAGGAGLTRETAAKRVGLESASAASNLVRLLELPERVRTMVGNGKLAESKARLLLPYNAVPGLVHALVNEVDWEGTREYLEGDVWRTALNLTRPMAGEKRYDYQRNIHIPQPAFKATPEQLDKLLVFELERPKSVGGSPKSEKRASNVKLWDQLQKEAVEELIEKGEQKSKLTPAQERAKEEEQAAKLERRLREWKTSWLRMLLADDLDTAELADGRAIKVLMWCLADSRGYDQVAYVRAACKKLGLEVPKDDYCCGWDLIGNLPKDSCQELVCVLASLYLDPSPPKSLNNVNRQELAYHTMPDDVVDGLARDFQIDLAEEWKLTQERPGLQEWFTSFLELHSKDQLAALAGEWKVGDLPEKRSALIQTLDNHGRRDIREKPYPLPACLTPPPAEKKPKKRRSK